MFKFVLEQTLSLKLEPGMVFTKCHMPRSMLGLETYLIELDWSIMLWDVC